ncbi:uncharacterized protein THITE_2113919 [Thermothielavioides terrestris NRRL 8126]|uniref:Uncharacterized protein n=1 Tax=Thermothielavioides terrestris (strain ATCC 38088 / NRRL 8126) TaxID=578455 RepID=G2R4Q0_THETT|nr:uncharacterized protein THITE_2113919 [Thermothielavioides terrestris NRRL 8126]AEO66090.1 hypothetical protein THITE_2113919 [Thermothielavioides terrestris NRRL 8126]
MRDPRRGVGAEAADAAGGGSGAGGTGGGGGDGGGAGHGGGGGDDEVLGSRFLHRELVRAWTDRNVFVLGQKASRVGPLSDPIYGEAFKVMVLLREMGEDGDVGRVVPFEDDYVDAVGRVFGMDGREKAALPSLEQAGRPQYVFQRLRHLVVNTVPALAKLEAPDFGTAPSAWDAAAVLNMIYIDERLDYERRANLLLRWGAMERLESLCLDLRGYSLPNTKYLFDEDIVRLASSLSEKGLSLLVIAGLRSYRYYGNPDPLTIEEVERGSWDARRKAWVDEERGRRINWWKMFKGAVRPGGRLVFVDKDGDDGNGWRPLRPVDRPRAMQGS